MKFSRRQILLFAGILIIAAGIGFAVIKLTSSPVNDGSHTVLLKANGATPDAIAVVKGSYVEFDARDGRSHNIGAGSGHQEHTSTSVKGASDSGIFGPDYGYRVSFKDVGTYEFYDHLNSKIHITVIVYEPSKTSTPTSPKK